MQKFHSCGTINIHFYLLLFIHDNKKDEGLRNNLMIQTVETSAKR